MEAHPITSLFPLMNDEDLDALAADIRAHGLREPITVWQGMILDGRNRWRACQKAGVVPKTVEWSGTGSPVAWVLSKNLYRYHLTPGQRAAIAVEVQDRFAQELPVAQSMAEGIDALSPFTRTVRISDLEEARRVKAQSPALFEEVLKGTTSVASASSTLYWRQREQAEAARLVTRSAEMSPPPSTARAAAAGPQPAPETSLYDAAVSQEEAAARRAVDEAVRSVQSVTDAVTKILETRATSDPAVVAAALRAQGSGSADAMATRLGEVAFYLACIAHDLGYRPE
jgi:hypothetical protein